jgi:choline dehydrogenase-like flavoprotein
MNLGQIFDAVVVGSGATGGWAAKQLTEAGMQVALVEAGAKTTEADFTGGASGQVTAYRPASPEVLRRHPIQANCYACREPQHKWFVDDYDNPYSQIAPYQWIRMRILGGRLLAWEGQCYRMSDLDFKAHNHDGYGNNWPISYEDLAPYYDRIEKYLGVTGVREGLGQLPDGIFEMPVGKNVTHQILRASLSANFNRTVTPARLARVTCRPGNPENVHSAPPSAGSELSTFASPWLALIDASVTGRLSLITNAVVSKVITNGKRATGVEYIDRNTNVSRELYGKVVVLCASTLESTRLLLNSGICNSSGTLGHYLMDHIFGGGASGVTEVLRSDFLDSSYQRHRVYVPRFRNVSNNTTDNFIRGYGFQGKSVVLPENGRFGRLISKASKYLRIQVILSSFCECLARQENRVELDYDKLDEWGIPTLRINTTWCSNEHLLIKDSCEQAAEMLQAAGIREVITSRHSSTPGLCIHDVGTARMGTDPRTSVLNGYCQSHDIRNLFVTDGACWVSSGCQNPTLTMLAITMRACDYLIQEFGKSL